MEEKVTQAIVVVMGSYQESLVKLNANLRKDLKMDCLAFLLLSYELDLSYETTISAHTVQDLVDILERKNSSNGKN